MKLKEAQEKIIKLCNVPFFSIFDEKDFETIIRNKAQTYRECGATINHNLRMQKISTLKIHAMQLKDCSQK